MSILNPHMMSMNLGLGISNRSRIPGREFLAALFTKNSDGTMTDSIGLLITPDQIRAELRPIFFDGETRRTDEATILLIEASEYLNNGWELTGNSIKGYAVYASGTTESVLVRAYGYFGESFPVAQLYNIGPYPLPIPDSLATPDWYVDSAATGAGTGLSWTDAFTTIGAAYTAASVGDVIEVSGGESGKTYTQELTLIKGVTIQGSKATGHDGLVAHVGKIAHNTIGIVLKNFKHSGPGASNKEAMYYYNGCGVTTYDMLFGPYSTVGRNAHVVYGGTIVHNQSKFHRHIRDNGATTLFQFSTNPCDLTFNYPVFDHAGNCTALIAGSSLTVNHALCLAHGYQVINTANSMFNAGNSALTDVSIKNSAFLGVHPLVTGSSSKPPVAENVFWHGTPGVTGSGTNYENFDSLNKATVINSITNQLPYFTTPRNTPMGEMVLRWDDRVQLDNSITAAATLNPEIKITHVVECHSRNTALTPTAVEIDKMRGLIADGNEIGNHSATHSDNESLDFITISATGTTPAITVATTNTGDSTTWTGSLTITINAVDAVFDLTDHLYDSLGVLVTALNGLAVGDGVVTAAKALVGDSAFLPSCVMPDIIAQGISTPYVLQKDDAAFVRFEITESILDLEAYINSGVDRNGANAVTGMAIDAPSPAYVCKVYAAPYGKGRASVETELMNNANIVAANASGVTAAHAVMYNYGANYNLYNFTYMQMVDETESENLFSLACASASGPYVSLPLWHGRVPSFNGSLANLKAMLLHFGLGSRTFTEYANYIRSDGAWTITEPNAAFTGNPDEYLSQGNYTLLENSPLKGAGSA